MTTARLLLAALFVVAGILHFARSDYFVKIVPDWLPHHLELVHVSGACEIAGGLGLLHPRTARMSAFALITLLFAVFPANINMAVHSERFPAIPSNVLWLRLPLQFVLMVVLEWCTRKQGEIQGKSGKT